MLYKIAEEIYRLESEGKQIVKMNIGEPVWPSPKIVGETAIDELNKHFPRYSSSSGLKEFREKLAEIHGASHRNITVEPGSKFGLYGIFKTLLKQGDGVLTFSPYWTAFKRIVETVGGEFNTINLGVENDWNIDLDYVNEHWPKNTKILLFNNPHNPTSKVWDKKIEEGLRQIAEDNDAYILHDNAYRLLKFGGVDFQKYAYENEILVETFSKSLMMSGWRIGYVVASEEISKQLTRFNQISITNVPTFIQKAAMAGLPYMKKTAQKAADMVEKSAKIAYDLFKSKGWDVAMPNAGFYIFPNLRVDTLAVFNKLVKKGYAIVPGAAFGNFSTYARISVCYSEDIVRDGLGKLMRILEE